MEAIGSNASTNNSASQKPQLYLPFEANDYAVRAHSPAVSTDEWENKTNVMVNYLPETLTQEQVNAIFSSCGVLQSCKLVRDKDTGESCGYAFVRYVYEVDAENAIKTLNGLRLQNKKLKVSLARPSSESAKWTNLYISGFSADMTQAGLEAVFAQCGKIIKLRILYNSKSGNSRCEGFVRYNHRHEAEAAIAKFHEKPIPNLTQLLTVKFAYLATTSRQKFTSLIRFIRKAREAEQQRTLSLPVAGSLTGGWYTPLQQIAQVALMTRTKNSGDIWCIIVNDLPANCEESTLWQTFGPFGAVQTAKLYKDPTSGEGKSYGYVTMSNYDEALLATQSLGLAPPQQF